MALERKVAIVDKYEPNLQRSQIDQDYYRAQGISIVGLLINIRTTPEEVVALISSPEKVEEELEKPIEEKVEEVERVEEKKKEEEEIRK